MWVSDAANVRETQEIVHVTVSPEGAVQVKTEKAQEETVTVKENSLQEKKDISSQIAAWLEISQAGKSMWEKMQEKQKESESTNDIAKIIEISRRISKGDRVPYSDEKKLMDYSMLMYQMAKSLAIVHENEKHKRHKALFEEEGEEGTDAKLRDIDTGGSTIESGSPAAVESAASTGGSETGSE